MTGQFDTWSRRLTEIVLRAMEIHLVLVLPVRHIVGGNPGRFGFDVFALIGHYHGARIQQLHLAEHT